MIEFGRLDSPAGKTGGDLAVPLAKFTMALRHDTRAEELDNLRLALATFALQLDAFELRAREELLVAGIELGVPTARPARLRAPEVKLIGR